MNPTLERTLDWGAIAVRILDGGEVTADEALAILHASDSEVPGLLAAAWKLRSRHFGNKVKLKYLIICLSYFKTLEVFISNI